MARSAFVDPLGRYPLIEPLRIVAGQRERVGLWMLERIGGLTQTPGGYEAIGVARGDRLVGGCLYTEYRPCKDGGNIIMFAAGHNWLSRGVIRELLGYPFRQRPYGLNCHRVTVTIARSNRVSRKLVSDLGFREEGKVRRGYDVKQDLMIYGLLRDEQKWV